jgi:(2Fe-2S) ferredoxin
MSRYQRHVFVCINERPAGHPKGCCLEKGSAEIRDTLKSEVNTRGLAGIVRVNNAGCLDACAFGVALVIYPDGIWYGGVRKEDVWEIVERTILNGEVIERLLIPDPRYAPGSSALPKLDR